MKKFLIVYNIIFLILGNVLISDIHHALEHDHNHNHEHNKYECQECLIIENNNFIFDFNELTFSNNNVNRFSVECFSFFKFSIPQLKLSRAPPIS